ncbi:MAG: hypothetical protein IKL41_08195 [Clostridia bacterium]|nr:hypothetical protein [Clostridia bacterium]
MKKEDITKVLSGINDEYIIEAADFKKEKTKITNIRDLFVKAPLAATVVILLLVGAIAYTAASRTNWSSSIKFDDGSTEQIVENAFFKAIPDTAPKNKEYANMLPMSHEEIEAFLGFDILHYANAENAIVNYDTSLNKNGSIARVDLWWPRLVTDGTENGKSINQSVYMLNIGAEEGYVLAFEEGIDAMGHKILLDKIKLDKLDTEALCYTAGDDPDRITVTFVYDSIMYSFTGHGYTLDEIISVIKELE